MTASELRNEILNVLKASNLRTNLAILDSVSDPDDILRIISFLENYISKYKKTGISIDYNTNEIIISKNVFKISKFILGLSANKFEKYSALISTLFGYKLSNATKQSHDQGIDFICIKPFELFDSKRCSYLIGQSKKYSDLVNVSEVRELAGAILLIGNREFSQTKEVYKQISLKSFTSIEGIFITSYFFSDPAFKLCENSDIITLDIIDLVLLTEKAVLENSISFHRNNIFVNKMAENLIEKIDIMS